MKIDDIKITGKGGDQNWLVPPSVKYMAGMKTMTFSAVAKSSTEPSGYQVIIQFLDVDKSDLVKDKDGDFAITADTLRNKDCKVACHCMAYILGGCLKGNIKHHCNLVSNKMLTDYERKTDNPNLTKNPNGDAQMCKHLAGLKDWIFNECDFVID